MTTEFILNDLIGINWNILITRDIKGINKAFKRLQCKKKTLHNYSILKQMHSNSERNRFSIDVWLLKK